MNLSSLSILPIMTIFSRPLYCSIFVFMFCSNSSLNVRILISVMKWCGLDLMVCTVAEPHFIIFVMCEMMYFNIELAKE
jgi:hypothetical protein